MACPEETAYRQGFMGVTEMDRTTAKHGKSDYSRYLSGILLTAMA